MNFTANSNDFAAAMSATIAAVQKRNTIPILSHVLLRASDGVISVTASDLDMEVSAQFQADGDDGAMTMEAATIFAALKKMPKDTN